METNINPLFYFKIYLVLLGLLALTIFTSTLALAPWLSTSLSLLIAAVKAWLVLMYFMKLKTISPKIQFFAFATLIWTFILISLISGDYLTRGLNGVLGK